jgi:hypothetical protein
VATASSTARALFQQTFGGLHKQAARGIQVAGLTTCHRKVVQHSSVGIDGHRLDLTILKGITSVQPAHNQTEEWRHDTPNLARHLVPSEFL